MLFNSIEFLLFFPFVVGMLFLLPFKYRWAFLLLASYFFYGLANGWFLLLIVLSTLIDYLVALKMSKFEEKKDRKPYLYVSLFSNLGLLILFKYFNFFISSFTDLFEVLHLEYAIPTLEIILPVGISFYTFQTLAYSIDVYRGNTKAESHFGVFALYVTYFPQLVAGPIERSQSLIPQLKKKTNLSYENVTGGLKLMAWGFFKKVVIADQIAPLIQNVTNSPDEFYALSVLLCSVLFSYQIYCDFSGYSDIAIGAAQIMGVKLMVNFRRPFASKSLGELWGRWHISLNNWFRDYLYVPLGGNRHGKFKLYRNVFIVFLISGLWHGASYNFIIWGMFHGIFVLIFSKSGISNLFHLKGFSLLKTTAQKVFTFLLFSVLFIFFYPKNIQQSILLMSNLFSDWLPWFEAVRMNEENMRSTLLYLGTDIFKPLIIVFFIVILEVVQYYQGKHGSFREYWSRKPLFIRWFGYVQLVIIIVLFSFDNAVPFYYFKF